MKEILSGWKTHITTVVLAFIPILGLFGIQVDPDQTVRFINDFSGWLEVGFGLLGALGVYFRELGKRE